MSPPPTPAVPDEAVVVSVPADPAYFRVLRLTAVVVAGELLDVEAVEDAQIGVEEAASILLDAGPTSRIEASFWCSNERLSVRLRSGTGPVADTADDFRRTILSAVVDSVAIDHVAGATTVEFDKSA
ncbi:MAG: hypothetical protein CL416_04600 [Acidimicrobiaceae bacterium]|nr:hypothetical protein [Acidimicrobiaceae bacterium]